MAGGSLHAERLLTSLAFWSQVGFYHCLWQSVAGLRSKTMMGGSA